MFIPDLDPDPGKKTPNPESGSATLLSKRNTKFYIDFAIIH